jgi:hypothetical protein
MITSTTPEARVGIATANYRFHDCPQVIDSTSLGFRSSRWSPVSGVQDRCGLAEQDHHEFPRELRRLQAKLVPALVLNEDRVALTQERERILNLLGRLLEHLVLEPVRLRQVRVMAAMRFSRVMTKPTLQAGIRMLAHMTSRALFLSCSRDHRTPYP